MNKFSVWLAETMDLSVDDLRQAAVEWDITYEEALDYLVLQWWQYVEDCST